MTYMPWIERTFNFDFSARLYPDILERLRGTPIRVETIIQGLPDQILTLSEKDKWSIQEHAGHLGDLESLWYGRIDDILGGSQGMHPADMSNQATFKAGHNHKPIEDITESFRKLRERLLARLDNLSLREFEKSCHHPRLNRSMRLVDLCFFAAEHDDFHLMRMHQLAKSFTNKL